MEEDLHLMGGVESRPGVCLWGRETDGPGVGQSRGRGLDSR